MKKFFISVYKETILVFRDIEGVLILFIMPMILVVVVALLEDKSFHSISDNKMPVVIIDYDNDKLSNSLINGLKESEMFELTVIQNADTASLNSALSKVAKGTYQIGILIPEKITQIIQERAQTIVRQYSETEITDNSKIDAQGELKLYFDPLVKQSFRNLAKSELIRFSLMAEMRIYFESFSESLGMIDENKNKLQFSEKPAIKFNEKDISNFTAGIIPNSVQHNVPAWILFGMFLICIPIAGNIIKERGEGCLARLKTMPVSYFQIISGKTIVYTGLSLVQASILITMGVYIMPLLGLPALRESNNIPELLAISLSAGLAATSFGILLGSISTTHMQASAFGSIATVIFAAVGGAWIPVIVMPPLMQDISSFSPMNWGIHGYYEVFLRNAKIGEILPDIAKLVLFSSVALALSVIFRKYKKTM